MRLLIDSMIAVMLVVILAVVLVHMRQQQTQVEDIRFVNDSLARLHEQAVFYRAISEVEQSESGFPLRVEPGWFGDALPLNVALPSRHPWVDVAPPGDTADHPPDPVVHRPDQAGFWYNPNRGIFRARVTPQVSREATIELYNRLNGTGLARLPEDPDPDRIPMALDPTASFAGAPEPVGLPAVRVESTPPDPADAADTRPTLRGARP